MNKKRSILISLVIVILVISISACQNFYPTSVIKTTQTPLEESTPEPIHWATFAPATTHTPTPTIEPLHSLPSGRIAFQSARDGNEEIYVAGQGQTRAARRSCRNRWGLRRGARSKGGSRGSKARWPGLRPAAPDSRPGRRKVTGWYFLLIGAVMLTFI